MTSFNEFERQISWCTYNPINLKYVFFSKRQKLKYNKLEIKEFYFFCKNFFYNNSFLGDQKKVLNITNCEFHNQFGWIIKAKNTYAFLGKIDICCDKLKIIIGRNSYISGDSCISGAGILKIGSFVCIGEKFRAIVENDNHSFNKIGYINFSNNQRLRYEGLNLGNLEKTKPGKVLIGNNCWIGRNVTIKNDVSVGDGACIGESSLVLTGQKIKSKHLYAGLPAKQKKAIKTKQSEPKGWWNWSKKKIISNHKLFLDT